MGGNEPWRGGRLPCGGAAMHTSWGVPLQTTWRSEAGAALDIGVDYRLTFRVHGRIS